MQFLRDLIFPGGFMTHGYCYLWTPELIGLQVVSDFLIALSCLSIPVTFVHEIHETVRTLGICLLLVTQATLRQAKIDCTEKSA
jgi:hypothetical protein